MVTRVPMDRKDREGQESEIKGSLSALKRRPGWTPVGSQLSLQVDHLLLLPG